MSSLSAVSLPPPLSPHPPLPGTRPASDRTRSLQRNRFFGFWRPTQRSGLTASPRLVPFAHGEQSAHPRCDPDALPATRTRVTCEHQTTGPDDLLLAYTSARAANSHRTVQYQPSTATPEPRPAPLLQSGSTLPYLPIPSYLEQITRPSVTSRRQAEAASPSTPLGRTA